MDKSNYSLGQKFLEWSKKKGVEYPNIGIFRAALIEAYELMENTTINGKRLLELLEGDNLYYYIAQSCYNNIEVLSTAIPEQNNVHLNVRGEKIVDHSDTPKCMELLKQFAVKYSKVY